jgi:RNA polymerase sigma-70 factor (ECF subfamily)
MASGDRDGHRTARPHPAAPDSAGLDVLRGRLVRLAVKLVWQRDDAEELVQEAFRIAAEKGPAQSEPTYLAWMTTTVSHLCLNHRRRQRPEPIGDAIGAVTGRSAEDPVELRERLARLRQAIDRLPPQQRLAVVLRSMEQRGYDEIAAVMKLSVTAVRTHVHLARRRLAESMQDDA